MPWEAAELLEGIESESESEAAEAKQPLRKPSTAPSYKPRAPAPTTPNYVTQTQLEAALTRSDGKIKTLTDGVSTLNARIGALSTAAKKEADQRKKSVDTTGSPDASASTTTLLKPSLRDVRAKQLASEYAFQGLVT